MSIEGLVVVDNSHQKTQDAIVNDFHSNLECPTELECPGAPLSGSASELTTPSSSVFHSKVGIPSFSLEQESHQDRNSLEKYVDRKLEIVNDFAQCGSCDDPISTDQDSDPEEGEGDAAVSKTLPLTKTSSVVRAASQVPLFAGVTSSATFSNLGKEKESFVGDQQGTSAPESNNSLSQDFNTRLSTASNPIVGNNPPLNSVPDSLTPKDGQQRPDSATSHTQCTTTLANDNNKIENTINTTSQKGEETSQVVPVPDPVCNSLNPAAIATGSAEAPRSENIPPGEGWHKK